MANAALAEISSKDFVLNPPVGDETRGEKFSLTLGDSIHPVAWLETWENWHAGDHWGIVGIKVTWNSGSSESAGRTGGTPTKRFGFDDGEKIISMVIHGGNEIDNISFQTDKGNTFKSGGGGGVSYEMRVGNGILLGFKGTSDGSDVYSLAPIFQK